MTSELRAKLDLPGLELDMSGLHASDTAGRTRSFKQFVEVGMHPEDAGSHGNHPDTTDSRSAAERAANAGR